MFTTAFDPRATFRIEKAPPKQAWFIDGASGSHIWADRYDGSYEEIFDLQDEILEKIVAALEINLTGRDRDRVKHKSTSNVEAYDLFLRGRTKYYALTPDSWAVAGDLFQQAIDLDPEFADPYTFISFMQFSSWLFLWPGVTGDLTDALTGAEKAVAIDDRSGIARTMLGWIQLWTGEHELAISNLERGLELDPTNAECYTYLAEALNYAGDPERGMEMARKAMENDPMLPPNCLFHFGHSHYLLGRFDEAVEIISRALKGVPQFPPGHMILAAVYVELGQMEAARKEIDILGDLAPKYTVEEIGRRYPHRPPEVKARLLDALSKAGLRQN